jgi:hypothetical protein
LVYRDFLKGHPNARRFGPADGLRKGAFAFDVEWRPRGPGGPTADLPCAATSVAAVREFQDLFQPGGTARATVGRFPVHFLLTEPPCFAGEWRYWQAMDYAAVGDPDEPPESLFPNR